MSPKIDKLQNSTWKKVVYSPNLGNTKKVFELFS